jgi:hypothetical protein
MEIRVNVDDKFLQSLQTQLGAKGPELAKSALTLLNWAAGEVTKGRVILSTDEEGENVHRLVMPALESVRPPEAKSGSKTS